MKKVSMHYAKSASIARYTNLGLCSRFLLPTAALALSCLAISANGIGASNNLSRGADMWRTIGACGLAVVLLGSPTADAVTFGDVGPYFFLAGENDLPTDVSTTVTQQQTDQGVKVFGSAGPITGAEYTRDMVLNWQGDFVGPIQPGDTLLADLNFDVQVTGGSTAWKLYADIWSNEGFEDARILTDFNAIDPSGEVQNAQLESSAFTQPGETGLFEGYLDIAWSGFSPTDTLTLTIPQNSLDFSYDAVPEPATTAFVAVGFAFLSNRRAR